jgi:hypothetical protein
LGQKLIGILEDDSVNSFIIMASVLHLNGCFWNSQWITHSPVTGTIQPDIVQAIDF